MALPQISQVPHTAVSMRFLGDPRMSQLLLDHGMELRGAERKVIASLGPRCTDEALRSAATWYLTDLDEDT